MDSTRVMVFIDGSNMFWQEKNFREDYSHSFRIDYKKLVTHLLHDRTLIRATYYCSLPKNPSTVQTQFLGTLRYSGIHVVEMPLKEWVDREGKLRSIEKGLDITLATDLVWFAWEDAYDVAILVSGDADYIGAVRKVMSKGKNVEVVAWQESYSDELFKAAVKYTFIDEIAADIRTT